MNLRWQVVVYAILFLIKLQFQVFEYLMME